MKPTAELVVAQALLKAKLDGVRRAHRGWCVVAVTGLWVCACSSDASPIASVDFPPPSAGGAGTGTATGTGTGITFAGKSGSTKGGGVVGGRFLDLCPEAGGVGVAGASDGSGAATTGGIADNGATGATSSASGGARAGSGGAQTAGSSAGGAEQSGGAGGAEQGGTGDTKSEGGAGGGGTFVPCPSEAPIALQQQECPGPGVCPYIDGTVCRCEACADGWCWSCDVSSLPLGCPHVPPVAGESCPWTGVLCNYGDCVEFDQITAGCCLGQWRVGFTECTGAR